MQCSTLPSAASMANNPNSPLPPFSAEEYKQGSQENDYLDLNELISSLPKKRGFIGLSPELILYRNFRCPSKAFPAVHSFCCSYLARDTDIILVSKPKSGTTWLKGFAFSTLCRNVFPPSSPNHPVISSNPHELVPFSDYTICGKDGELLDMASFPTPQLFATHIPHDSLPESIHRSACRVITNASYNMTFMSTK